MKLISPNGLHVFRLFYSLYLLCEVISLMKYYNVTFGSTEGMWGLYVWIAVIAALAVGFFTTYAAILNYVFSLIYFTSALSYAYHAHFIAITVNLLLIFIPTDRTEKVPQWWYYILAAFSLGFVYLDSFLFKIFSQVWRDGLAVWLGSSYLPIAVYERPFFGLSNRIFLDNEFLMKFANYGTLAFELSFFFLLFTRFRWILAAIGVLLHLSIAIVYPLKFFGLQFMVFYILLVPVSFWRALPPLVKSPVIPYRSWVIVPLIALELAILTFGTPIGSIFYKFGLGKFSKQVADAITGRGIINQATGLSNHPLFIDNHFIPRSVYMVKYQDEVLPFTTESGLCHPNLDGIGWKQWSSSIVYWPDSIINKYVCDWSKRTGKKGEFIIYSKDITPAKTFQRGFLKKQIEGEWREVRRVKLN